MSCSSRSCLLSGRGGVLPLDPSDAPPALESDTEPTDLASFSDRENLSPPSRCSKLANPSIFLPLSPPAWLDDLSIRICFFYFFFLPLESFLTTLYLEASFLIGSDFWLDLKESTLLDLAKLSEEPEPGRADRDLAPSLSSHLLGASSPAPSTACLFDAFLADCDDFAGLCVLLRMLWLDSFALDTCSFGSGSFAVDFFAARCVLSTLLLSAWSLLSDLKLCFDGFRSVSAFVFDGDYFATFFASAGGSFLCLSSFFSFLSFDLPLAFSVLFIVLSLPCLPP